MPERENILLVAGASSDMGTYLLSYIGDKYDCVIVIYRRMNEELRRCLDSLNVQKIVEIQADFTVGADLDRMLEVLDGTPAPTHIVHFPAPVFRNNKFHKMDWSDFEREIDISLKSFVVIAQTVLPKMVKSKYGRIVMMSSYAVENIPPRYCSNYVTVKYAMLGLMKALAAEYADKGITVNGVAPSLVETKYMSETPEIIIKRTADSSPLGRNLNPEDVIPAIEFLLSDSASCINGHNIVISCGRSSLDS